MEKRKIVVAVTGASGMPIFIKCLEILKKFSDFEIYLILSESAKLTLKYESEIPLEKIYEMADYVLDYQNIGAVTASGSFKTEGMIIVPCSMKTVAGINSGYTDNLILRTADVMIKEQKKLILVTRESPLSQIHLRNLYELSKIQNIKIVPPMLVFYQKPETIDDIVNHIVARILEPFGIEMEGYRRWKGLDIV